MLHLPVSQLHDPQLTPEIGGRVAKTKVSSEAYLKPKACFIGDPPLVRFNSHSDSIAKHV